MHTEHLVKFSQLSPHDKTEGGFRTKANRKNFPILQGMSLYKLVLEMRGAREPHWHPNADELGYCLKGSILVNLYHTDDERASFLVRPGEVFLIPSGALHSIENVGESEAELLLQFSHEDPEDFHLSSVFGMFSDAVLGNTWNTGAETFRSLKRSLNYSFAALCKEKAAVSDEALYGSVYRFDLEGSEPILANKGGSARMARQSVWPIAKRQALYSLILTGKGMREPHWHPETAEMGYVSSGKGRMSILNGQGHLETYVMEKGDLYFIPKAYPHHIENLTKKDLHILVFFDQPAPADIGLTASVLSQPSELLAACMHTDPHFFSSLKKYYKDQFLVEKINPTD